MTKNNLELGGMFKLGVRAVKRTGYGAMQLAGPGAFGPPKDRSAALAVLRAAVESGVDHIDTSDIYGPHVTNELIREALHPYPKDLVIATKVGAIRGPAGSWDAALSQDDITTSVHDNLRNLGVDTLEVVNLRVMFDALGPVEGSIEEPLSALIQLQRQGKVRSIGLSNVTAKQVEEGLAMTNIACVQNHYNLVHRNDDALIDHLAAKGIAYVPFFPLGGFAPIQSAALSEVASNLDRTPMQVALAWLLGRSPNILLIPGTSSIEHLRENLAAADLELSRDVMDTLDRL
jgi:pyridoxine 4-dehydrogenase